MILLTSYRPDGRAVRTPVRVRWDGDRARARVNQRTLDRIWARPTVEIDGRPARARIVLVDGRPVVEVEAA